MKIFCSLGCCKSEITPSLSIKQRKKERKKERKKKEEEREREQASKQASNKKERFSCAGPGA